MSFPSLQKLIGYLFVCLSFVSCSSFYRQQISDLGPTLADLPDAEIPVVLEPVAKVSREEIEAMYRSALEVAENPELQRQIKIRLADISMARNEAAQLASEGGGQFFSDTINQYEELIKVQAEETGATDERLLYRVSKAFALDTRMTESDARLAALVASNPESAFAAEAQFRRAEQAFSQQEFNKAYELYTAVADFGEQTPFFLNAVYMQGWSLFKQDRYHQALEPFGLVMDKVLPPGTRVEDLSESQKSLLADTMKVMGFSFSYLDGPETIAEFADRSGDRQYQDLIYRQLGDLYLDKRRYRDAANTYLAYVTRYPDSDVNPEFVIKSIEVYLEGGFIQEVLPAKEAFIERFGSTSEYWQGRTPEQRASYSGTLETYLDEVSSYYHAEAQALLKAQETFRAGPGKKAPSSPEPLFLKAAGYYADILNAFPANGRRAELTLLRADALHDAGQLDDAVLVYEEVAYNLFDGKQGATAGYAAILTMDKLLAELAASPNPDPQKMAVLAERRIASAISFADHYPADERAIAVLTNAAERLYRNGQRDKAIEVATGLTVWQPPQSLGLQKTAWLVLAHSQFETEQYEEAEAAYRHVLTLLEENDQDRNSVLERIAASMYKLAEQEIAAGAQSQGINRLLSIALIAPATELAINGQFDAANYLIELKDWKRAERVLVDFRQRFPDNALTKSIVPKLAVIYQETEQWEAAAEQLAIMSGSEADPETKRSALYLSAELYQKSGRSGLAEKTYQDYIKRYPEPFDLALEARVKLLELARESGAVADQERLMKELIQVDVSAGKNRNARSTYLAAQSQVYFAAKDQRQYEAIRLRAPIKKTLKEKRQALDKTLASYESVINYGVAEFVTEANHRIGEVYANLYQELLDSERPQGLDELTLEQYEILLEEQAYPFKGKAVEMLVLNAERSWDGFYDKWVKQSFEALEKLLPARYGKKETVIEVSQGVY
jgi:TolA-binding protein